MQFFWKFIRLTNGLFFAVTCFLGFLYLMFVNLTLSERLLPGIVNLQQSAGHGKPATILAFIVACPIPMAAGFAWYRLFDWIDTQLNKISAGDKVIIEVSKDIDDKAHNIGGKLALYAGLYGFSIMIGMIITNEVYSFLDKNCKPRSQEEFFTVLLAIPILATVIYIHKRFSLMKRSMRGRR